MPRKLHSNDHDHFTTVEQAAKVGVSAAALAYVAGVLIVNVHLAGKRLPSPELSEARYVLVGALWLFFVATMYVVLKTVIALAFPRRTPQANRSVWWLGLALSPFLMAMPVGLFSLLSFQQTLAPINTQGLVVALLAGITALIVMPAPSAVGALISRTEQWRGDTELDRLAHALTLVMQVFFSTLVLAFYATYSYPAFSKAIGGGAGYELLLSPVDGQETVFRRLQIPVRGDGLIGPCELLFEDDDTYFLLLGTTEDQQSVRVSKSLFHGARASK